MNVVKIITCDSKIWNVEQVILDITQASFKGPVVIDLLQEGPCNQSINLDHLLNSVTGLKVQSIQTANKI